MKTCFPYIFAFSLGCLALRAQTITNFLPRNGKEGTLITITGTGFSGNVEVAFGTSDFVTATVRDATSISAEVPSDASAGKVKVRVDEGTPVESPADLDGNGTENEETDDFRYVSIISYTPTSFDFRGGYDTNAVIFTITGTGFPTNNSRGLDIELGPFCTPGGRRVDR